MMKFIILITLCLFGFAQAKKSRPVSPDGEILTLPSNPAISYERIAVKPKLKLGFATVWDPRTNATYFVDHSKPRIYRYSWNDKQVFKAQFDKKIRAAFAYPTKEFVDQFFVGAGNKVYLVKWDGISKVANIIKVISEVKKGTSMNHAVAGPHGEFIFGTLSKKLCGANATQEVYQYSKDSGLKKLFGDIKICSGVVITNTTLYHLDACLQQLIAYDRDYTTGEVSNKRVVIQFDLPKVHLLVGLVIDSKGFLWSGLYGASAIIKIDPIAATFEKIPVPAKLCADPGFSGPNRDIVMIATGSNLPHFYKGEYNNEDTDAFSTQFNTTLAGSLIAIHGLNATSNEILLPSV